MSRIRGIGRTLVVAFAVVLAGCSSSTPAAGSGEVDARTDVVSGDADAPPNYPPAPNPCQGPAECDDENPCTTDACEDHECRYTEEQGCVVCQGPADCDGDPFKNDTEGIYLDDLVIEAFCEESD